MMLTIQRYSDTWRESVWLLHQAAMAEAGLGPDRSSDQALQRIEAIYLPYGDFYVGLENSDLVAMGGLRPSGEHTGAIEHLYVHPEMRRRGYGRQMMDALETRALALGWTSLQLDTLPSQRAAQQLAMTRGYVLDTGQGAVVPASLVWLKSLVSVQNDSRSLVDLIPY